MSLSGSLFTGLTGLDTSQTWMNVIGNNIANANTTAFKSSNVSFSSQFYVTDLASSGPTGDFGGTNPAQSGMGDQIAAISTDFTPGQLQTTGVDTNMAISGNGFFVVNSPAGQQFTRDGTFTLNGNNQLVTSGGDYRPGIRRRFHGQHYRGTDSEYDNSHRTGDHRRRHAKRLASGQFEFRRRRRRRGDHPHQPGVQHRRRHRAHRRITAEQLS